MTLIWHNGSFASEEPVFSASDRIRIGDGVFDTMLAVDGLPIFADLHFKRLFEHADILEIPTGSLQKYDLIKMAKSLLSENKFTSGQYAINTILSRGPAERGLKIPEAATPHIVMNASPLSKQFSPIHAILAETVRRNEGSPLSRIKSFNYGDHVIAMMEAKKKSANEAILMNNKDFIACASSGNIFAVLDGKILTPPTRDGAMNGIIRGRMIERYGAREQSLTLKDLENAHGLFLTNSIRGVTPLETFNEKKIPKAHLEIDKELHLR